MSSKKRIAILGATSHIAKGLIFNFSRYADKYDLYLFARSAERIQLFLKFLGGNDNLSVHVLEEFVKGTYEVVINCVGIGKPALLKKAGPAIFSLTERYDTILCDYLEKNSQTRGINFSSGAVYGKDFSTPAEENSTVELDINHIEQNDYYCIAKINSEAKHRALAQFSIIDIRIFSYFSRFIDLDSEYFLTDLISCIKTGKEFITTHHDMIRDFIHPQDLFSLIEKCIEAKPLNDVFDAYSLKPITKSEILEFFSREYGLTYSVNDTAQNWSPTGSKEQYYSDNRKAHRIGYSPRYTSLDCIIQESKALFAT